METVADSRDDNWRTGGQEAEIIQSMVPQHDGSAIVATRLAALLTGDRAQRE
jgi:hypothetical protein